MTAPVVTTDEEIKEAVVHVLKTMGGNEEWLFGWVMRFLRGQPNPAEVLQVLQQAIQEKKGHSQDRPEETFDVDSLSAHDAIKARYEQRQRAENAERAVIAEKLKWENEVIRLKTEVASCRATLTFTEAVGESIRQLNIGLLSKVKHLEDLGAVAVNEREECAKLAELTCASAAEAIRARNR